MVADPTPLFILLNSNKLDKLVPLLTSDNANAVGSVGQSLLHQAVSRLNVEAVRVLLGLGANPDAIDRHGDTPLIYAACRHNHDIQKLYETTELLLDAGANPNVKGSKGMTAIRWAVGNPSGDFRLVRLLLQRHADPWIESNAGGDAVSVAKAIFPDLAAELERAPRT